MYATLRENVYGSAMYSTDIQADFLNMARREGESDLVTNFHNWTLFTSSNGATASIW